METTQQIFHELSFWQFFSANSQNFSQQEKNVAQSKTFSFKFELNLFKILFREFFICAAFSHFSSLFVDVK